MLDPWQENVLQAAMGERSDGQWATPRVGLAVPRQNGKGALIEARELAGLLLFDEQLIIHSAHDLKTARVGFDRIVSYFENYDDLRRRVKKIGTAVAREYIELNDGRKLRFLARSKSSGRGFSADCLILDEAQELSEDTWSAIMPTVSARPNPQIWVLGTPPAQGMSGEVFTRFRTGGREGKDHRLCWCEWGADPDCDLDDKAAWRQANPALGIRVTYSQVADEREALDDESFGRERLGMWSVGAAGQVIDPMVWAACADPSSKPTEQIVFGLDVSPDRSRASVAVASWREDGLPHVEVIRSDKGTGWMVEYLVDRVERWHPLAVVLDAAGPAGGLITSLQAKGVEPQLMSAREMGQACGELYDLVVEKRLRHLNQPLLNVAVDGARKRTLQDAWAWHRRDSSIDITPLVAVTQALHGLLVTGAKPKRERTGEAVFI